MIDWQACGAQWERWNWAWAKGPIQMEVYKVDSWNWVVTENWVEIGRGRCSSRIEAKRSAQMALATHLQHVADLIAQLRGAE